MSRLFAVWFLGLVTIGGEAIAAPGVLFDPNGVVPNQVVRAFDIPTPQAIQVPNALVYSSPLTNVPARVQWTNFDNKPQVAMRYWKVANSQVVEMTPAEKTLVDQDVVQKDAIRKALIKQSVKAWLETIVTQKESADPSDIILVAFIRLVQKREGLTDQQIINALSNEIDTLLE